MPKEYLRSTSGVLGSIHHICGRIKKKSLEDLSTPEYFSGTPQVLLTGIPQENLSHLPSGMTGLLRYSLGTSEVKSTKKANKFVKILEKSF